MTNYSKNSEDTSFYKNLILNDRMDTSEEFDKECLEIIKECKICSKYDLLEICYSGNIKEDYQKIKAFFRNFDVYTKNEHIVEWIAQLDIIHFKKILDRMKIGQFGNVESVRKKQFPKQNLPIIRIMKYCLQNKCFEKYYLCAQKLEAEYVAMFVDIHYKQFETLFTEDKKDSGILYLFSNLEKEYIEQFFSMELLPLLKTASYRQLYYLIKENTLPRSFFMSSEFIEGFQQFALIEQINLIEIMEDLEYSPDFIKELHSKLNKQLKKNCEIENILFEVSSGKFQSLYERIKNSSYFKKNGIAATRFWELLTQIYSYITLKNPIEETLHIDKNLYEELMNLYQACRNYATQSIVDSLYHLDALKDKITYLENAKFNILARVSTMWDCETLEETFEKRTFCGFSILNENNFSHFGDDFLYGYYTNVFPDSIAHIYPMDSLSNSWAKYEKDLSEKPNWLLDIEDLNNKTYELRTYNQLCIRTKTKNGKILYPDCIVCTNNVNESAIQKAEELDTKILVLKKNPKTIEFNEDPFKDYS